LSWFGKTEFADIWGYLEFLDDRKYSIEGWADFGDMIWDEAVFVASSKSFCFEKEWNITAKFTEIDKTIIATNNVVAMIPRMDFIKSGEMGVLKLFLYSLGKVSWDVRTRDSRIPFVLKNRSSKSSKMFVASFVMNL
jgi:hypothetical protein